MVMLALVLAAQMATVDQLAWLAGCWSLGRADGMTEEQWLKPAGGSMLGVSRTVKGGKTVEYEFLQLREVNGTLTYIAKPSGQSETPFPLKTMSDAEAIFENPTHDFPQRIIYRRTADGITARIEGRMNNKDRGMDFVYKRCS